MMQYMSLGRAETKLAEMIAARDKLLAKDDRCGIDEQHLIYLNQNIDAYERVITQFKETCKAQRANDD